MLYISGNSGGSDQVVYPLDHLRQTAAKLLVQAGEVQAQHDLLWQQIQRTIAHDLDPGWFGPDV